MCTVIGQFEIIIAKKHAAYVMRVLYWVLLYLLDSMRTVIGQFCGPYPTVWPAKFKTLFLRSWYQNK